MFRWDFTGSTPQMNDVLLQKPKTLGKCDQIQYNPLSEIIKLPKICLWIHPCVRETDNLHSFVIQLYLSAYTFIHAPDLSVKLLINTFFHY